MAADGLLDTSRRSEVQRVKFHLVIGFRCLLFLGGVSQVCAQEAARGEDRVATAQKLYSEKKWEETVLFATGDGSQPAELDYLCGMALMHLERWEEARDSFSNGL